MNKKLPKLYVNKIDKLIDNNEKVFYSASKKANNEKPSSKEGAKTVKEKIKALLNAPDFIYKKTATITFKNKSVVSKDVTGEVDGKIVAIGDELISIDEIEDIKF